MRNLDVNQNSLQTWVQIYYADIEMLYCEYFDGSFSFNLKTVFSNLDYIFLVLPNRWSVISSLKTIIFERTLIISTTVAYFGLRKVCHQWINMSSLWHYLRHNGMMSFSLRVSPYNVLGYNFKCQLLSEKQKGINCWLRTWRLTINLPGGVSQRS